MNGDDDFDTDEIGGPSMDDILATWAQIIQELRGSRVCLYAGPQGDAPDFEDFIRALPLIGDCDALVYCEPTLTKVQAWQRVKTHRLNLQIPTPIGFITNIEMVDTGNLPLADQQGLFGQPVIEWVAADDGRPLANPVTLPPENRLWGDYCRVTIAGTRAVRVVRVLHLGIGGAAVWTCFLQPRGIQPVRVIASPPWGQ